MSIIDHRNQSRRHGARATLMAFVALVGSIAVDDGHAATPSPPNRCPIEQVVGRVLSVRGDVKLAVLRRHGRDEEVTRGMCLLSGDRIVTTGSAEVRIDDASGARTIGRYQDQHTWDAPAESDPTARAKTWGERLSSMSAALFADFNLNQPTAGFGRGERSCATDAPAGAGLNDVRPLDALPVSTGQSIGADLPSLYVAWAAESPHVMRVSLVDASGRIVASTTVCGARSTSLSWPPGALKAGDRFTLRIADESDRSLLYAIEVVATQAAPDDGERIEPTWLRGAWALKEAGPARRLEALTNIASGAQRSYAANAILSAVLSNARY